jgi:hypothetical protein
MGIEPTHLQGDVTSEEHPKVCEKVDCNLFPILLVSVTRNHDCRQGATRRHQERLLHHRADTYIEVVNRQGEHNHKHDNGTDDPFRRFKFGHLFNNRLLFLLSRREFCLVNHRLVLTGKLHDDVEQEEDEKRRDTERNRIPQFLPSVQGDVCERHTCRQTDHDRFKEKHTRFLLDETDVGIHKRQNHQQNDEYDFASENTRLEHLSRSVFDTLNHLCVLLIKKFYTVSPVMKLVRVWTDVGSEKNVSLVARIIETNGPIFTIQFLSPTETKDKHGCTIYKYEDETYQVDDDSITHYLDTSDEGDIGFVSIGEDEWIRTSDESDEDYIPSEEDSDDDEQDEEDEEGEFEEEDFGEDDVDDDYDDGDDE